MLVESPNLEFQEARISCLGGQKIQAHLNLMAIMLIVLFISMCVYVWTRHNSL